MSAMAGCGRHMVVGYTALVRATLLADTASERSRTGAFHLNSKSRYAKPGIELKLPSLDHACIHNY
jgi:hypothetical protein